MRKDPKENGENPSSEKTDKTSNTENIIEDACKLRFRWTQACHQDDQQLQISQGEEPNKNQERWCKDAMVWALDEWYDQATH